MSPTSVPPNKKCLLFFFLKGVVTCCAFRRIYKQKIITHRIRSKYSILPMRPHLLKTVDLLKNKKGYQSALNAVDFLNADTSQYSIRELPSYSILIPLDTQFAMLSSYSILIPLDTQYRRDLLNTETQVKYSMLKAVES